MIHLPFFSKYPYTSMEQINLDWLMNEVGQYSRRIEELEKTAADHEERITTAEGEIDELQATAADHETRITQNELDIADLKPRVATNETEIAGLKTRLTGDEALISALQTEGSQQGVRITTLENKMDTAQGDIINLQTENQSQENDIDALDSRVTTLEGNEVIANPGGTGANLNTLSVAGTTYVIPQGGGGGGTSVTPNPQGTPTDILNSVDIDGTVYSVEGGITPSVIGEYDPTKTYNQYDVCLHDGVFYICDSTAPVTGTWNSSKWNASDISFKINRMLDKMDEIQDEIDEIGSLVVNIPFSGSLTANGDVQAIPGTNFSGEDGQTWLVIAHIEIDTRNYGSTPRFLGFYLRTNEPDAAEHTNYTLDKFSIYGSEPAMITQAASLNISYVVRQEWPLRLCLRCNSTTNKSISYNGNLYAFRIG